MEGGSRMANTILLYHYIQASDEAGMRWFSRHMEWISRHRAVSGLQELLVSSGMHRTAVTIDDGGDDVCEGMLRVAAACMVPVTLFVATRSKLMSKEAMERAAKLDNIALGAHTQTHKDVSRCSKWEVEQEIEGSIDDLKSWFGIRNAPFAFPFGRDAEYAYEVLSRLGYRQAYVTREVPVESVRESVHGVAVIPRIGILRSQSDFLFRLKSCGYTKRRLQNGVLGKPR